MASALAALYLAVMSGHLSSMDGLYMARQARAFVVEHSVRFQTPVWTWRPEPTWNSNYGIGLSLLYAPGMLAAAAFGLKAPIAMETPPDVFAVYVEELYKDPLYIAGASWVHALIVGVSALLVARLVIALGGSRAASLWGMAFYGLGSSALVYSRGDFAQALEGLCWAAAILAAVHVRRSGNRWSLPACGAAVLYAILTRPVEGALLVPAVAGIVLPAGTPVTWRPSALKPAVLVCLAALGGVVITLVVNWVRFGDALRFGYDADNGWVIPDLHRWAGALVSPGRGILWEFPAILLLPFGALALVQAGRLREVVAMLVLCAALFVNTIAWYMWFGGWCWGLRLFTPATPLLASVAGLGVDRLKGALRRWLPVLCLLAGFVWALPGTITDVMGGYGNATGEGKDWLLTAYPPIGAWQFVDRWFATGLDDAHAVDILWFRLARATGYWSVAVPLVLLAISIVLGARGMRLLLRERRP